MNLLIRPELGDSVSECFEHAWKEVCSGKYREVHFEFNGVLVNLKPANKRWEI